MIKIAAVIMIVFIGVNFLMITTCGVGTLGYKLWKNIREKNQARGEALWREYRENTRGV